MDLALPYVTFLKEPQVRGARLLDWLIALNAAHRCTHALVPRISTLYEHATSQYRLSSGAVAA